MRTYKIHHVDSFTNTLFGGNPTVAVLNADSLKELEMKKIAQEMNLSESSFMLPSKEADFRLRFFTPAGSEIKFCGHATLGALCAISHEKLFGCDKKQNILSVETGIGIINVEIDLSNRDKPSYIFNVPKIHLVQAPYTLDEVAEGLGIAKDLLDKSKPVMLEKTNNYIYMTARNLDSLGNIKLDIQQAVNFSQKDQIIVICILTDETFDRVNHIHARGFAPLVGLPEDPFTGSMQGGLIGYARCQGIISDEEKLIAVEQGHFMNRPGFAKLEIINTDPFQVRMHCEAVHVFSTELRLPKI